MTLSTYASYVDICLFVCSLLLFCFIFYHFASVFAHDLFCLNYSCFLSFYHFLYLSHLCICLFFTPTFPLPLPPHPQPPFLPSFLPVLSTWPEPSAPPRDITCSSTSSTTLLVSWRPPPPESQNGDLVGYRVLYQVVGRSDGDSDDTVLMEENAIPASDEQVVLRRLEKWTQYRVTVSAATEIGSGPESEPALCRTDEDGTWIFNTPYRLPARWVACLWQRMHIRVCMKKI